VQPERPTITLTFTGVDITEVLLALASAGLEVPRPEHTQPADQPLATVLRISDTPGAAEQLTLAMQAEQAERRRKQHPVPRNYQVRAAAVAAWLAAGAGHHGNSARLDAACRASRNGRNTVLAVLDWLTLNGGRPDATGVVHGQFSTDADAAELAGVTIDMWRKTLCDLRSLCVLATPTRTRHTTWYTLTLEAASAAG
jgi:hypothetical protein